MQVRSRFTPFFTAMLAVVLSLGAVAMAPPASAAVGTLTFVGTSNTAGNHRNHTVTIPASTVAGDALVLFLTMSSTTSTINNPAG